MKRSLSYLLAATALMAFAGCSKDSTLAPAEVVDVAVMDVIALPIRPEAIALGNGSTFFAGSSAASTDTTNNGLIYRGDFSTGVGTTLVAGVKGKATSGLAFDARSGLLYAAETKGGTASVYDGATGAKVMSYTFPTVTAPGHQINDVVVASDAVYFTDSYQPVMYRVALGANGAPGSAFTVVPLSGDYVHNATAKPFNVNSNGIAASADGKYVILDNMGGNKGVANANCIVSPRAPADSGCVSDLLRVDPATGVATRINFGAAKVYFVDGIRLYDHTLYLAQNFLDRISVFTLSADYLTATFVKDMTSPNFIVPSSMVVFQHSLFAVNAGFGPGPYQVSRVAK